jgi:hypothetical protein
MNNGGKQTMDKKEKITKEQEFTNEINSLNVIGFSNIKDTNNTMIYFTRKAYGKVINGWSKYSNKKFAVTTTIRELKDYMIEFGQIQY